MKEGKNEKGKGGWPAGPRRRRPEMAGQKPQAQAKEGASVVHLEKLKFWKWCFGERSYTSLEIVRRGEEDGVVGGGQGGVGGGGYDGETLEVNGFLGGKRGRRRWWRWCCCCWNGRGDREEKGGGVGGEMGGDGGESGRPRRAPWQFWAAVFVLCWWEEGEGNNE